MRVYWDSRKASTNLIKHGIHFADAVPALFDERAITVPDDVEGEKRYVTLGMDALARVLVIVYTWREEGLRIISARKATRRERIKYSANP